MDQNNYPEMLGKTAIINGGAIINMVFPLIRPFLDSRTQNKIEVPAHPSSPQTCCIHSTRTPEGTCGCPHCLDASDSTPSIHSVRCEVGWVCSSCGYAPVPGGCLCFWDAPDPFERVKDGGSRPGTREGGGGGEAAEPPGATNPCAPAPPFRERIAVKANRPPRSQRSCAAEPSGTARGGK